MIDKTLIEFLKSAEEFIERMDPERPDNMLRHSGLERREDGSLYFKKPAPYVPMNKT